MSERLEVRRAAREEANSLQAIAEAAYAMYVDRMGRRPAPMDADFVHHIGRGDAYVAVCDGDPCGYIVLFLRGDHLFIENVAVHPGAQGRGVGAALLAFAEAEARRGGKPAIELYTNAKMTENLVLYPRLGYRETDRRTESGFDRVFFRKELTSI